MRKTALLAVALATLYGCATTAVYDQHEELLELTGEMLFEGSNTLQMPANLNLDQLAKATGIEKSKIKTVGIAEATLEMGTEDAAITESLLLQVVSNNHSLLTIGTLSPLPEGTRFKLSLAEKMNLVPYLNDEGTTWVLDLNISEDLMDDMTVAGKLRFSIHHNE
ncbi:MAG: hypothetical protein EA392_08800 [Cryomorphaceae bacterium]|nr:MAG: hypothetical protein EA392_08800 [Cryomorphaceae bacterium]